MTASQGSNTNCRRSSFMKIFIFMFKTFYLQLCRTRRSVKTKNRVLGISELWLVLEMVSLTLLWINLIAITLFGI